jgi:FK506-binding nuclear protein
MKNFVSILTLLFAITSQPALAAGPDSPAPTEGADAGGALVEKKAEKVKPKKKAKAKKQEEKVATDAGSTTTEEPAKLSDALKPVQNKKEKDAAKKEDEKAGKAPVKRTDGLVIEDLKKGSGMEAALGKTITVHYKGTLMNGKVFDESYGGDPISFQLEEGRLIKGWTEGIPGMKVGGKRKLKIPYALAYGERGTPDGSIPPRSDLNFEVELIKVE